MTSLDELQERLLRRPSRGHCSIGGSPERGSRSSTLFAARGVEFLELTVERAEGFASLERVLSSHGDRAIIGAGTVLAADDVRRVAWLGAQFIVSPNTDPAVISTAHEHGLLALPGAFSATEVATATSLGARFVKLFPASVGVGYSAGASRTIPSREVRADRRCQRRERARLVRRGCGCGGDGLEPRADVGRGRGRLRSRATRGGQRRGHQMSSRDVACIRARHNHVATTTFRLPERPLSRVGGWL